MSWIGEVIVDILVTVFIALSVWLGDIWMWWVIAIYSGLLLIAKGLVLTGDSFLSKPHKSQAPEWFIHFLYALNVVLLGWVGWWYLCIAWGLIWLFSYLGQRKVKAN